MKKLKIKFRLLGLLAVFTVSVFITSCEQTEIINTLEEQVSNTQDDALLLMPHGFETLNEGEKAAYFDKLTEVDYVKLVENHRVGSYLRSIDKYWELYDRMKTGQLILDIDLSKILTAEEVTALSNYQYDNIEIRIKSCKSWKFAYSYFSHHPHYQRRCMYKRRCTDVVGLWAKAWTEYKSNTSCTKPGTV